MPFRAVQTYGEVMRPLRVGALPADLQALLAQHPKLLNWVLLGDQVHRAEKVSSWTEWDPIQAAIYRSGEWAMFSHMRGYTADEIKAYGRYLDVTHELAAEFGEEALHGIDFEVRRSVTTPQYEQIERELARVGDAYLQGCAYGAN